MTGETHDTEQENTQRPLAYSYVRFSSEKQRQGASLGTGVFSRERSF